MRIFSSNMRNAIGATLAICALGLGTSANATMVSVFDDGAFVDTSGGSSAESDTVQAVLTSLGHTVTTFTGTSAAAFSAGIGGSPVLLFPELEVGDLGGALSGAAIATLQGFLGGGGRIIVTGSHFSTGSPRGASLVNAILGTAYGESSFSTATTSAATAAAATSIFAGHPTPVPNLSGTSGLTGVAAGDAIYTSGGDASVAYFATGGALVYLGYDWFDAAPLGATADGGWAALLDTAVRTARVPEPAMLMLFGIGLVSIGFARRKTA